MTSDQLEFQPTFFFLCSVIDALRSYECSWFQIEYVNNWALGSVVTLPRGHDSSGQY